MKVVVLCYSCVSLHSGQKFLFWMGWTGLGDEKRELFANPTLVPTCSPVGRSVGTARPGYLLPALLREHGPRE